MIINRIDVNFLNVLYTILKKIITFNHLIEYVKYFGGPKNKRMNLTTHAHHFHIAFRWTMSAHFDVYAGHDSASHHNIGDFDLR